MTSAAPVAAAKGGAVADQSTKRGRDTNGSAGVCSDGGKGGTLENAGGCSTGRSAGQSAFVAGLLAVAELRIFAGNPISERVEMGLTSDDRAGDAELLHQP